MPSEPIGKGQLDFARLVRFYNLNPKKLIYLDDWIIDTLLKAIEPLRSEERVYRVNDYRISAMEGQAYRNYAKELLRIAQPYKAKETTVTINPEQEKWFRENGIPYKIN